MSSLPAHIKEILKNLEFLAMVEKGKKPCLADMTFVDGASWVGAVKRSRNAESKKNLLIFIDGVVEQTFNAIRDPRNRDYVKLLINSLSRAKVGINNTQTTYQCSPSFLASIRVTLKNIELQLETYSNLLENYSNPSGNSSDHSHK